MPAISLVSVCILLATTVFILLSFLAPVITATDDTINMNPLMDLKEEWLTPLKEGDKVPEATFVIRVRTDATDEPNPFDWKTMTTEDYFGGKRVVLFALPGAFTPTCSTTHLPGYEKLYEEIKQQGVDDVYCKYIVFIGIMICACDDGERVCMNESGG
jgi:hypothetical protein